MDMSILLLSECTVGTFARVSHTIFQPYICLKIVRSYHKHIVAMVGQW